MYKWCVLVLLLPSFCWSCYYLEQAFFLGKLYASAKPLEEYFTTSEAEKALFLLAQEIRSFAFEELGLKKSNSYTTYVRLERDFLTYLLTASKPYQFQPYHWDYPLVGSLTYRGFYRLASLKEEAARLRLLGYETYTRKVQAFSTLGFFSDPLFSFMTTYSPYHLANLIIHELAHGTIFLPGDASFNENIAQFIGDQGSQYFIISKYGLQSVEYQTVLSQEAHRKAYQSSLNATYNYLETVYQSELSLKEKKALKEKALWKFQKEWFPQETALFINNAYLLSSLTYYEDQHLLQDLYTTCEEQMSCFLQLLQEAIVEEEPRVYLEQGR